MSSARPWLVSCFGVVVAFALSCDKGSKSQHPDPFVCQDTPLVAKPMQEAMVGEEKGEVFDTEVRYLDEDERTAYAIGVAEGRLTQADGSPYDTAGELAIFVLSPDGVLYASTEGKKGLFHHSTFLSGGPIAGAGELAAADGKLTVMTDRSGHYRPAKQHVGQTLCWLADHGVDLAAVEFRLYEGGQAPASSMIQMVRP